MDYVKVGAASKTTRDDFWCLDRSCGEQNGSRRSGDKGSPRRLSVSPLVHSKRKSFSKKPRERGPGEGMGPAVLPRSR